jgi:hypothetical protein
MPDPFDPLTPIIITRFSFIGNSGWKVPVEERERIVFDPDRLKARLWMFERITLASLRSQTEQAFHHYILTSDQLPSWAMAQLNALCAAAYPPGRYTIDARPVGNAREFLRRFLQARVTTGPALQIVLDDDDGLACDFLAHMRAEVTQAALQGRLQVTALPYFLSWASGFALVFSARDKPVPQVFRNRFPYINLGLTMVNTAGSKNILAIDHQGAPKRAGCTPFNKPRMFIRSVHDFNDSRVAQNARWKPVAGGLRDPELGPRFAFLSGLSPLS